ncbi:MAG: hypothetical protein JO079_14815, partial [Frankiaceae bacterium]|nr:hypothetical protein [Frankiaceae bacterium]
MTFLVALIGVLSVQFAALTPVGRRFRDRYVPRWVRPKYAFFVAFGLPWAVAIVLAVLTVIGEGVAFAFADLIALFVVMMVMNATGMVEGRINVMFTTPEPIPDPWLLLSFRDRHKIKKAARRGR